MSSWLRCFLNFVPRCCGALSAREDNDQYSIACSWYGSNVEITIFIHYFDFDCNVGRCCVFYLHLLQPATNYVMADAALRVKYVVVQAASFMSSKRQGARVERSFLTPHSDVQLHVNLHKIQIFAPVRVSI